MKLIAKRDGCGDRAYLRRGGGKLKIENRKLKELA
jgi:hypothetical protein